MAGLPVIYSAGTVDQWPKNVSSALLFGGMWTFPIPDVDRCEYLLVMGANPHASQGSLLACPDLLGRFDAIRARGGKVVVVDPRRTGTVKHADEWLPIRPGGDAALPAGRGQRALRRGARRSAQSRGTGGRRGGGGGAVRGLHARGGGGADRAHGGRRAAHRPGARRGRPRRRVRAHRYLQPGVRDPRFVGGGRGERADGQPRPTRRLDVLEAHRVVAHLAAAAGVRRRLHVPPLEVPGARALRRCWVRCRSRASPRRSRRPERVRSRRSSRLPAIPSCRRPEGDRLDAALPALECMIAIDNWLNETSRHAHVILPGHSVLEQPHYDEMQWSWAGRSAAKFSPPGLRARIPSTCRSGRCCSFWPRWSRGRRRPTSTWTRSTASSSPVWWRACARFPARASKGAIRPRSSRRPPGVGRPGCSTSRSARDPGASATGCDPDGLTLAKIAAQPDGIDLGPHGAPARRDPGHALGKARAGPRVHRGRRAAPARRAGRCRGGTRPREPAPRALQQLLDAQRAGADDRSRSLHAAGPPGRRALPRPFGSAPWRA